jgi:hypothetical protein
MTEEETAAREISRDLSWKHFDLHAKQRIEVFKSYLTLVALIFAGYGVALQAKLYSVGMAIACFAAVVSVLFWFLDKRTRALIKLSEGYLKGEEQRLAATLQDARIALFTASDRLSDQDKICDVKISYGRIFSTFFFD